MENRLKRFTNRLFRRGTDKNLDLNSSAGWGAVTLGGGQGGGSSPDWLKQYHTNPRLAALNKLVNDTGVSDFAIYHDEAEKGKIRVKNHPLEEEINSQTVPMFFSLWTAYRYMSGVVYITYEDGPVGPHNFKVYTDMHVASSDLNSMTFNEGDRQITVKRSNVIIDRDLDILDPYNNGYGRAGAIQAEIESDKVIQEYLNMFYANSARADIYISPSGSADTVPTDEELQNFAAQMRNFHQGIQNSHKTAILSFPATITTAPNNHMEMELLQTRKYLRDTSIQHFSIPPEIMGIVENSNKATVVAAEHIYANQVRVPLLKHIQDIINSKILPKYIESSELYFEFDDILPDDVEMDIKIAKEGREGATLTINEHRELLGFPRLKGDIGNTLMGSSAVTAEGETGASAGVVEVEPDTRDGSKHDSEKDFSGIISKYKASEMTNGKIGALEDEIIVVEGD